MSTKTGPVAWNAFVADVHKELALEAGIVYAEYASHKAFLAASKEAGIVRSDAMQEASRRKAAAAGKKAGVAERAERYRITAEAEEAAGVPMREAPSTYSERAVHKIRLEMRGLPMPAKASKPSAPKVPKASEPSVRIEMASTHASNCEQCAVSPVKWPLVCLSCLNRARAKAEPEPVVTPPVKPSPKATSSASAPAPKASAPSPKVSAPKVSAPAPKAPAPVVEDPHAENRRAFIAEGNEEVVVDGKTYYRMSTGEGFTPGEEPYTIAEYVGIWDADLGEFVIDE